LFCPTISGFSQSLTLAAFAAGKRHTRSAIVKTNQFNFRRIIPTSHRSTKIIRGHESTSLIPFKQKIESHTTPAPSKKLFNQLMGTLQPKARV
jgi:hypothetical protein